MCGVGVGAKWPKNYQKLKKAKAATTHSKIEIDEKNTRTRKYGPPSNPVPSFISLTFEMRPWGGVHGGVLTRVLTWPIFCTLKKKKEKPLPPT